LDLACEKKSTIAWLGAPIFIGWMVASLVLPRVSDIYGRKWLFAGVMTINLGVVVVLIFSKSILVTVIANFFVGVVAVARWTVGYIMLQEFLPVK